MITFFFNMYTSANVDTHLTVTFRFALVINSSSPKASPTLKSATYLILNL